MGSAAARKVAATMAGGAFAAAVPPPPEALSSRQARRRASRGPIGVARPDRATIAQPIPRARGRPPEAVWWPRDHRPPRTQQTRALSLGNGIVRR